MSFVILMTDLRTQIPTETMISLESKGLDQGSLAIESGSAGLFLGIRDRAVLYLCDCTSHFWYRGSEEFEYKK